jgi:hypothetical protein
LTASVTVSLIGTCTSASPGADGGACPTAPATCQPGVVEPVGGSFEQAHRGQPERLPNLIEEGCQRVGALQHAAGQGGERGCLRGRPGRLTGSAGGPLHDGAHGRGDHDEDQQRERVVPLGDGEGAHRRREEVVEQQARGDSGGQRRVETADEGDPDHQEQVEQDLARQVQPGLQARQCQGERGQPDRGDQGALEPAARGESAAQQLRQPRPVVAAGLLVRDQPQAADRVPVIEPVAGR